MRNAENEGNFEFDAKVKTTGGKVQNTSIIDSSVVEGIAGTHKLIVGVEHYKKESDFSRGFANLGRD